MRGEGRVAPKELYWHKSLRNPNINYQSGWWSVSIQVAKNKSILGAIVGEKVVLNTLGRAVDDYWRTLPKKYPELEIFDYVVMPNHFHALLRIHYMPSNREHHLGFLMSRFKGGTSFIYGKMRRAGGVEDIGEKLWQRDYWDDLVSSEEEFKGWQKYIRENPANWSSDRYGACTAYALGDTELLNRPRIAFVASQGFLASELRPRKIWPQKAAKAACSDRAAEVGRLSAACSDRAVEVGRLSAACSDRAVEVGRLSAACSDRTVEVGRLSAACSERAAEEGAPKVAPLSGGAASAAPVLISTFTSAQEREALRRALAKRRPLVAVFPAGIPEESALEPRLAAAICEGWALAISPQAPGSRLNKKIATWCNEFLLKNADEIWVGHLSPNGMLAQMLAGLGRGSGT